MVMILDQWPKQVVVTIFFKSVLLRICFLCWDRGNGDVPPTLDADVLCSSRAGSGLGLESRLVEELYNYSGTYLPYKLPL